MQMTIYAYLTQEEANNMKEDLKHAGWTIAIEPILLDEVEWSPRVPGGKGNIVDSQAGELWIVAGTK